MSDLVGLGCVDDILSIAKRKSMDTSAKIESTDEEIGNILKELDTYGWVEKGEELLGKATDLEPKIERLTRELESLSRLIVDYKVIPGYPEIPEWLDREDDTPKMDELSDTIGMLERYIGACRTLSGIVPVLDRIGALGEFRKSEFSDRDVYTLSKSIDDYTNARRLFRLYTNISGQISRIPEPHEARWDSRHLEMLNRSIVDYDNAVLTISDCKDYLDDAYDSLVGVACPVCGRPMDKDSCLI